MSEVKKKKDVTPKKAPKKESDKEKKIIKDKYYAGTNIEKLPKIPKKYIEDIMSIETLTSEQLEKYYTAIILGIVPDRFGLEISIADKLKAAKGLTELREAKLKEQAIMNEEEQEVFAIDFVIKQKKQADELVDDDSNEEIIDYDNK